jgi:hypothetical protein
LLRFSKKTISIRKIFFTNEFFGWLSSLLRRVFYYLYQSSKNRELWCFKVGTVFLYILVATIGTHMNLGAILDNPLLFLVGIIWITTHIIIMIIVAKIIKAPFFYVAVGSQANIGGAASAPIVAAAGPF